jgi:hypothetical protein
MKRAAAAKKSKTSAKRASADGQYSNRGRITWAGKHTTAWWRFALALGREAVMLGRVQVGEIMPTDGGRHQACFRLTLPDASAASWRPAPISPMPGGWRSSKSTIGSTPRICGRTVQHEGRRGMSRLSTAELDDIKARNPLADIAGGYTSCGARAGAWSGPCPVCGGKATSQRFEILEDGCELGLRGVSGRRRRHPPGREGRGLRLQGRDRAARRPREIDKAQARKAVRGAREEAPGAGKDRRRQVPRGRAQAAVEGLVRTRSEIHGSVAEAYLEGRGLVLPQACPGLRFLPHAPYFHGEQLDERGRKSPVMLHKGPAMLAAFIRPTASSAGCTRRISRRTTRG